MSLLLLPLFKSLLGHQEYLLSLKINCLSYDARYRYGLLTEKQLEQLSYIQKSWIQDDLKKLSKYTGCIRTYYSTNGMEEVPEIADSYGLDVILGLTLRDDRTLNSAEIKSAVRLAASHKNIRSVIVGNETLLGNYLQDRKFVPESELIYALKEISEQVSQPVSTAEPLNSWLSKPELLEYSDFIALNEIPYWAKISPKDLASWLDKIILDARSFSKGKPVMLSEIGWPTRGPAQGKAKAGGREFEKFASEFMRWNEKNQIDYNLIEAFDQPWKAVQHEGRVGSHWGIIDAWGNEKFGLKKIHRVWPFSAAATAIILSLIFVFLLPEINYKTRFFSILTVQLTSYLLYIIIFTIYSEYLLSTWLFCLIIVPALTLLFIQIFIFLRETALVFGLDNANKNALPAEAFDKAYKPFVSLHVACRNEPPGIVIACLESLLRLDYEQYEIILVDNNTSDAAVWQPVEKFCSDYTDKIKFIHVENLSGFKAGALNLALQNTSPEAQIVGLVDSDYIVECNWLKDLVPLMSTEKIAGIQAPQAQRDWEGCAFSTALRDEYEGFFHTGMVVRSLDNAIIQHGSMVLIKANAIKEAGGWDTGCITEDTELGLRLLEAGYRIPYINKCYGAGLVPATYDSYKNQRSRWVMGAMQILRSHRSSVFSLSSEKLSTMQKYHFIAGWLPWITDIFAPVFTLFGIILMALILYSPRYFPPQELTYPILFYVFFRQVLIFLTYRKIIGISTYRTLLCSVASMSLTNTIAFSVIKGMIRRNLSFVRTEKIAGAVNFKFRNNLKLLADIIPGIVLLCGSIATLWIYGNSGAEAVLWGCTFFIQSLTCISALVIFYLQFLKK